MRRVRSRLTILLLILVIVTSLFSLTFGALVRNGIIFQQRDNIRYLVFGYAAKDILLLLIAVAAVAVLITVTSRSTTNPIRELSRAAREIAGGNYDVTVPERDRVEEFGELNDDLRDKQFKAQFYGGIMGPIMGNTSQVTYAVTVCTGGVLMFLSGFTPGELTVFANYSRQFSMPINMISQQMSSVFSALAGAERVFRVMDTDPEPADRPQAKDMPKMQGYVRLEHVSFGYTPDKEILHDISLYAKPGQKIAFVGSTGAGKTTVTNLLNRFYDIDQGSITIDGEDIQNIQRDVLRKNIAMVLQDTHLFTGTVMENIRYGRPDAW